MIQDCDRFKQVLSILVSNSIKFTQKGSVLIKVSKMMEREQGETTEFIKVQVEDTGTGIKEEDKDKLFKLYGFLEETQVLNTHGIGLGLVISQ